MGAEVSESYVEDLINRFERHIRADEYLQRRELRRTPEGRKCLAKGHDCVELREKDTGLYYQRCRRCGQRGHNYPKHFYCRCDLVPVLQGESDAPR